MLLGGLVKPSGRRRLCKHSLTFWTCSHFPILALQVSRPITLKKDNIQTRNRKLALKARRKGQFDGGSPSGTGMEDFFKPFDSRFGYGAAASAASSAGSYLPGTGYYGQMQYHPSMAASVASNLGTGFGPAAAAGFSALSTAVPNPMMAGATA